MDASTTRAAALTAAALMLAEAAWFARPRRILPLLEPGLGAPPSPGRPAPGDGAARGGPDATSASASVPRAEDVAAGDDDLRDAPGETAAGASRGAPALGSAADADGALGQTRRGTLFLGAASAPARSARLEPAAAGARAAATAARAAAEAARRLAAENAEKARRLATETRVSERRADEERARSAAAARLSAERGRAAADAGRREDVARRGAGAGRAASLFEPTQRAERGAPGEERAQRARRGPERRERGERRRREEERDARRERRPARRYKPLLLGGALGPKSLRPPAEGLAPPAGLLRLADRRPPAEPDGRAAPTAPAGLDAVESLDPRSLPQDRHAGAHWDRDQWHDGPARGVARDGSWVWTYRDGARWWALAGDPPAPLLRHDGAWWLKGEGMWFVVHDGEPWALRRFNDWDAQGLFHPSSGTQIVYSADYSRAAVITPGQGAQVFDARTGALIGTIPEDRMPATRRPKPPQSLPTPPAR